MAQPIRRRVPDPLPVVLAAVSGDVVDRGLVVTPDEERAREIVKKGWNLSHNWMELPATANDLIRLVAQALARERREENEACAKVLCRFCRAGEPPVFYDSASPYHYEGGPPPFWHLEKGAAMNGDDLIHRCDAAAIRARQT